MKKYLLSALIIFLIALTFAFVPVSADETNQSREQLPAPTVSNVTFDGEAVEPIVTSVEDTKTSTSPQAQALKQANTELESLKKEAKNEDGKDVTYLDYSKLGSDVKKALDKEAKKVDSNYNSSVYQVSSLFEFSLPEGKVASKDKPVTATFSKDTNKDVVVIHKIGDNWAVIDSSDVTQTQDSVTVTFTSLCPVAFLTINADALVPSQGTDLTWLIWVAIAAVLIIILLVVLLHKPKDKVVAEDEETPTTPTDENEGETEEESTGEEPQEETPVEEETSTEEEPAEEPQEETPAEEPAEEPQEETPAEEPTEEPQDEPQDEPQEETPVEEQPTEEETPVVAEAQDSDPKVVPVVVPADSNEEKKPLPGKYEVYPVGKGEFFIYRLKASNGEIMVISELYKSQQGACDAIETVIKNVELGTYDIYQDKHNLWQFKLYSSNKRLLVASANYRTEARCKSACESFKRFAPISPVVKLEEDVNHLMEEIDINPGEDKKGGKIIIDKDNGENETEFRLVANNGTLLCSSMSYKTRSILVEQANNFYNIVTEGTFYVVKDKNKMFQFKLYSATGRCILIGETYGSKTNAISAANSVARFAKLAEIIYEE